MDLRTGLGTVREAWKEFGEDHAERLAAALAYYVVFSLAPLLVVVTAIAGAVFDEASVRRAIFDQAQVLVGRDGAAAMHDLMARAHHDGGGTVATVLGVLAMLVGASGVFVQLREALDAVWGVRPRKAPFLKGFFRQKIFSVGMVFAAGFLLLVSLVVNTAVAAVTKLLSERIPGIDAVWPVANFVLTTLSAAVVFALLFRFVPDVRLRLRQVLAGAAWTAVLFAIGQVLLGLYLGRGTFASAYGAAGSFVILLVWVFYSSQVVLFGAELTQVLARRRGEPIEPTAEAESLADAPAPAPRKLAAGASASALFVVAVPILAGGCRDAAEIPDGADPGAAIVTEAANYVLRPAAHGDTARIVATLTAPPDTALHLLHCNGAISWGLQRREGDTWTNAWVAETNGCLSAPLVVPAGGAHTETLQVVSRVLDPPSRGPVRSDVPAGTYRVVWFGVLTEFDADRRPHGPELALEGRVSAPVTIERDAEGGE